MMNSIYFVFDLGGTLLKLNTPHFTHLSKMEQKKNWLRNRVLRYDIF